MALNLKEFLARQLNDHSDSPSGVIQKTYFEWPESHISDAICLALGFVYSLLPDKFSELKTYITKAEDCLVEFCEECNQFTGVASLTIDGNSCIEITEEDTSNETNNLLDMLDIGCTLGTGETPTSADDVDPYSWHVVKGSSCIIKFDRPLPIGAIIKYLCATPPGSLDDISDNLLKEYGGLIADFALWWLYRTDTESRSNLDRADRHFDGMKYFVETKLLLEFSLREEDYLIGRRKVDD